MACPACNDTHAFCPNLSPGIPSCNGAPEGDPISVAALAVVCAFAESLCLEPAVAFDTYVDNWSWSSLRSDAIERAVPKALGFLRALRLPVDWTKSYTWATSTRGRQWWRKAHDRVFPDGVVVPAVTAVRDLGVAFKFDGLAHAASRGARLQDGIERLEKLRHQPRSICLKASMIQRGVCLRACMGLRATVSSLRSYKSSGAAPRGPLSASTVSCPPFLPSALCLMFARTHRSTVWTNNSSSCDVHVQQSLMSPCRSLSWLPNSAPRVARARQLLSVWQPIGLA